MCDVVACRVSNCSERKVLSQLHNLHGASCVCTRAANASPSNLTTLLRVVAVVYLVAQQSKATESTHHKDCSTYMHTSYVNYGIL
jgi:hypothetical protein